MIPTRVSLKNFLTFAAADDGTHITFDFDGATLWSIAGVNGVGKSAIFDAITYALFGEHRGGRQQDNRLIRKGATTAEVVFEFLQGGERYRVERSVTRKVGRQGQVRPDSKHVQGSVWSDGDDAWVAVPDTDKPTELERWLRTRLGMGPETFSSSVLLRQGEADKLLNAKASQRFRILAGLIDLRVYQRLEQLAIERRKAADATTEALDQQLADVEEVTDDQLAAAGDELTAAGTAVAAADTERIDADRRWTGAQRHAELQARHKAQVARRDELFTVTAEAEGTRAAAAERRHLDAIAEPVTSAFQDLADAAGATATAEVATTQRDAIDLDRLSAHQVIADSLRDICLLARLGAIFEDAARTATDQWLRDTLAGHSLAASTDDPEWSSLVSRAREAALAGHDLASLVEEAIAMRALDDANSTAAVLHWRLGVLASTPAPRQRGPLASLPPTHGPAIEVAQQAGELMRQRWRALRTALAASTDPLPWARPLGARPNDPDDQAAWLTASTAVTAYRERYEVPEHTLMLGPRPAASRADARAAWDHASMQVDRYLARRLRDLETQALADLDARQQAILDNPPHFDPSDLQRARQRLDAAPATGDPRGLSSLSSLSSSDSNTQPKPTASGDAQRPTPSRSGVRSASSCNAGGAQHRSRSASLGNRCSTDRSRAGGLPIAGRSGRKGLACRCWYPALSIGVVAAVRRRVIAAVRP